MKLSQIPFKNLRIGDKCTSARDTPGIIVGLLLEGTYPNEINRYNSVRIKWDNGNNSYIFHMDGDRIEYLGSE